MSRQMFLSILALYNYKETLFNKMTFPDGFTDADKQDTISNILSNCAELDLIYPDWDFLNQMIGTWSRIEKPVWQRIYNASLLEYNPIENYNRTEIEKIINDQTEQHSGIDSTQTSGRDTHNISGTASEAHSGIDITENNKYAYDSGAPKPESISKFQHGEQVTSTSNGSDTMEHGRTDMFTHGEKIKHDGTANKESHISGNIGVTTSQQMLEQELEITPKLNIINYITESFKNRFCILVY